jgi:hypothetical protein
MSARKLAGMAGFYNSPHFLQANAKIRIVPKLDLSVSLCILFSSFFLSDFDRASLLICGNKMPTRCNRCFLLQI